MTTYPASIAVDSPEEIERWRPLVQWIMALPHLVIAAALEYATAAIAVVSWFVVLFTGRLPEGLAKLQISILRYTSRAEVYAAFLHDQYPAFEFAQTAADPGGSPVVIDFEPALGERDRLTVALRLLWLIPAALYAIVIAVVGIVCWVLAFFAVIATGRWPEGLRTWVLKMLRVGVRLQAYALLLTDEYPPFSTD